MKLEDLQKEWDLLGQKDPLWAVLSHADKAGNRWDLNEFLATGREEIRVILSRMRNLGLETGRYRALDFGCGVGRLSQALCEPFREVTGIDIAASMIAEAGRINRFGARCRYLVNTAGDLGLLQDGQFDFVLSRIVLQHMNPGLSRRYIQEFFRVLAAGGVAVFQLPSHRAQPAGCTRIERPLTGGAFRAGIETEAAPRSVRAGGSFQLSVKVRNLSGVVWPALGEKDTGQFEIHLGNHWLDQGGVMLVQDDGRAALPKDLSPDLTETLSLAVKAPSKPGAYILELDMVQEHVAWFADRGSTTLRLPTRVVEVAGSAGPDAAVPHDTDECGTMWMDGIPQEEVARLIAECGAELVSADDDASAPGWVSYTYYARKGHRGGPAIPPARST